VSAQEFCCLTRNSRLVRGPDLETRHHLFVTRRKAKSCGTETEVAKDAPCFTKKARSCVRERAKKLVKFATIGHVQLVVPTASASTVSAPTSTMGTSATTASVISTGAAVRLTAAAASRRV
jgi:hypothetical protein